LEIIERTGNGLATIINDILDISKVEAGKMEIEKAPCPAQQIFRDLEALLSLRCEAKGIQLKVDYQKLPNLILTDAPRLKQILLNVVGNAIKFTGQGVVSVEAEVENGKLKVIISDTGVGISQENIPNLFQPFAQLDHSIRKQFGGTGLGLTLSKRLAQLLGGDVTLVQTDLGRGSTFMVTIELKVLLQQPSPPPIAPDQLRTSQSLQGMRILIVEDSLDNQLLAEQYLNREGARTVVAHHGAQALEEIMKSNFDFVLMDMQMPIMDGYTATSQLRKMGYQMPIVALTAHAMKEDLQKCLSAGCDDYLCKPFRRNQLIEIITRHCRNFEPTELKYA
jgi:CheY-like chemotaxis protein